MGFFTEQQQKDIKDYCLMPATEYISKHILQDCAQLQHPNFKHELQLQMNDAMSENLKKWVNG